MPVPIEQLLPFLLGSILVTVVPGPDMALVTRQVLIGGTSLAQRTIFGNLTGLVVHAVALAAGLSALLAASAEAYTVVKIAGAAYLVLLGVQTLRSAHRGTPAGDEAPPPRSDGHPWEVAHNPFWKLDDDGSIHLPGTVDGSPDPA